MKTGYGRLRRCEADAVGATLAHMGVLISAPLAAGLLFAAASPFLGADQRPSLASSRMGVAAAGTVGRQVVVPAMRGQVVSARTGLPIAGASVFGVWLSEQSSVTLHIAETKSAGDGTFILPKWVSDCGKRASLDRSGVILFRRDYRVESVPLARLVGQREVPTIPLSLFVGPPVERAIELSELLQGLVLIVISAAEPRLPEIVMAIEAEQQTLPEDVRRGRMGRPEFEWMVNEAQRARRQANQGTK